MRFGINSFLLTSGFTGDDLPVIEQFRAWGADMAELAIFDPDAVDTSALRRAIEAAGMENCPVCGIWPEERDLRGSEEAQQNSLAYTGKLIALASEIGSRIVAGPMYSCVGRCELYTDAEKAEQSDTIARHLATLCARAEDAGVTLCLEPLNRFETDCMNTLAQASAMIEKVGSPALKIHADTFHMNIEEADPARAIRRAGDHIGHVHASGSHRGIPGTGHVDWRGIFSVLKEIEYGGDICIETFSADNDTIARAVSIWIRRFDTPEQLATEGLSFLRNAWDRA
jgi:D-psicose/D-tagatose/L-ribulose 3-epimerase